MLRTPLIDRIQCVFIKAEEGYLDFDGKRLEPVTEETADGLELLCIECSVSIEHCAFGAMRHPKFEDRVVGSRVLEEDPALTAYKERVKDEQYCAGQPAVAVAFYGLKK